VEPELMWMFLRRAVFILPGIRPKIVQLVLRYWFGMCLKSQMRATEL